MFRQVEFVPTPIYNYCSRLILSYYYTCTIFVLVLIVLILDQISTTKLMTLWPYLLLHILDEHIKERTHYVLGSQLGYVIIIFSLNKSQLCLHCTPCHTSSRTLNSSSSSFYGENLVDNMVDVVWNLEWVEYSAMQGRLPASCNAGHKTGLIHDRTFFSNSLAVCGCSHAHTQVVFLSFNHVYGSGPLN